MLYDVKVEFIQKDNTVSDIGRKKKHQIFEFINNQYGDMDFPNMHNYIVNIYDEFDGSWKFDRSMDLSYNPTLDCSENIMAWIVRYYANLDSLSMNNISIKEISSENMNEPIALIVDISTLEDIAYGCPIVSTKVKPENIKLPINAYIYVEHNSNVAALVTFEDIEYNPNTHRYDWYIQDYKVIDKSLEECGIEEGYNTIKVVPSFLITKFYE